MLKILVTEDEPPILRSISAAIKSCGEEYVVAGTAYNGKAALNLIEKAELEGDSYDLVFTDIRMPVMDGLELAESIYTCHPEISVVVISGYHEFKYVQSALRSHVMDYITKPVSRETMKELLDKVSVKAAVQKKALMERSIQSLSHNQTVVGENTSDRGKRYAPFLFCAGAFPSVSDTSMMPGQKFWHVNDIDGIMKGKLLSGEEVSCFDGKSECERIAVFEVGSIKRCRDIAHELFEHFEKDELFVTIIYPESLYNLNDVGDCLNRMRIKLQSCCKYLHLSIIGEFEDVRVPALTDNEDEMIISYLMSGKESALESAVRYRLDAMVSLEATQNQISHFFKKLISTNAQRLGIDAEAVNSYLYDVDFSLTNSYSTDSLCESLVFLLTSLVKGAEKSVGAKQEPAIIGEIEEYLKAHFTEDLTNSQLSQVFNFVPSYLSKMFRTYRGVSPSEYLTKHRIKTAIGIMRDNPGTLIKEAAASVGLHDQYYFSKLFKKETGMSPSEYFKGSTIKQSS